MQSLDHQDWLQQSQTRDLLGMRYSNHRRRRGAEAVPQLVCPVHFELAQRLADPLRLLVESMSDGATLGVLIGGLRPDQARATLRATLDRALGR